MINKAFGETQNWNILNVKNAATPGSPGLKNPSVALTVGIAYRGCLGGILFLSLNKIVEDLAECVKDIAAVCKIHEKRIQQLEKKMDRLLKEAKDGSRARRGRGGSR